jgi:hypothetical protein
MKHPLLLLFAFAAVTMLLTLGSVLNSACRADLTDGALPRPKSGKPRRADKKANG